MRSESEKNARVARWPEKSAADGRVSGVRAAGSGKEDSPHGRMGFVEEEMGLAFCRSIVYEALSRAFCAPREDPTGVASAAADASLFEAAMVIDDWRGTGLAALVRRMSAAADAVSRDALIAAHELLFDRGSGQSVAPYETDYAERPLEEGNCDLPEISEALRSFGLVLDTASHDRIDHIACELEFLSFLTRREAHAIQTGDTAMRESASRAVRLFLQQHLGRFVSDVCARMRILSPGGFHGELASLCAEFVKSEAHDLGVAMGPGTSTAARRSGDPGPRQDVPV